MKKTHSIVLSSLVLSGAVLVMAPYAWSQTGGSSGTGSSQKSSDAYKGSSSSSSSDMHTQKDPSTSTSSSRASTTRMSKDKVKAVQAALKNKGMDPGPEDGVLGPKTQQALREFQKSNNLSATGRLDDKTVSALGVDAGAGMGSSSSSSGMGNS